MRITNSQTAARPVYYDRNPTVQTVYSNAGGLGPHGETVRGSYTVPAGKKAYIESIFLRFIRLTVAAPEGGHGAVAYYTKSGGSTQAIANRQAFDNVTTIEASLQQQQFGLMNPGDTIDVRTSDSSTGGTVSYLLFVKLTEFDA